MAKSSMTPVSRRLASLALLAALAMPGASAEEPADAPALWHELFGEAGVKSVTLGRADGQPGPVRAGEQVRGAIAFNETLPVAAVRYQACEIGSICFAIGLPAQRQEGNVWTFDTTDLPVLSDLHDEVHEYPAGARAGFQFFVCLDNGTACADDFFTWHLFPEGFDFDHPTWETDYQAWSETHYFGIDIAAADRGAPPPALAFVIAGILAVTAFARRW